MSKFNFNGSTDSELVSKFVAGSWEAANALYLRYQDKFYNLAFYLCGDAEVAEDVVTINASKIFYAMQTGSNIDYSFSMYQAIIAEAVNKNETSGIEVENVSHQDSESLEFLASTLLSVPFENRAVFVVKEFLNLSKTECCKVLKISEADYKLKLQRTQRVLARALGQKKAACAAEEENFSIHAVSDENIHATVN